MLTKKTTKIFFFFLALLLVNIACGVNNEDNLETSAAATVEVELTKLANQAEAALAAEIATEELEVPVPVPVSSSTSVSTNTPIPTSTNIPTSTTIPTDVAPCDVAGFIEDVTVPDGSDFIPGENFTKTWRLKNVGSCTWTTAYDLVFYDGDQMGGVVSQPLIPSGSVAPNQTVDISVDLTAPAIGGVYTGYWKLRNASNVVFELASGNPFSVKIDVIAPTATSEFPIFIPIIPQLELISPDFTASYSGVWDYFLCSRKAGFQIDNIGAMTIESLEITIEGPIGNEIENSIQNFPFHNTSTTPWPGCSNPGNSNLAPGETDWVYVTLASEPLPGITGQVTINVCSLDDLGGFCREKTFNFIW